MREFAGPFFLSLFVSTTILATGNIIQVADLIINKGISVLSVMKLFMYLIPWVLTVTIPISVLAATLLAFGRLASDNEITALRANGVSMYRIASPLIIVAFIISLLCVSFNDKILPEFGYKARKIIKEIGVKYPDALLEPGVVFKEFKEYIVFIYSKEGNKLENIIIYQPQEGKPTRTIVAEEGEIVSSPDENIIKLKLRYGSADEALPQDPKKLYKLVFDTYYMTLNLNDTLKYETIDRKPREMSIDDLRERIRVETGEKGKEKSVTTCYIELHNKLALGFSNLVFILLGMPIAIRTHRREISINFALAGALFILYWVIMLAGIASVERHIVPPWAGVWMANGVLFFVGLGLFIKFARK